MTHETQGPVISLMLAVPDATVGEIRGHEMPWGIHRQGGFFDPFGHRWLVGDRSPLSAHNPR